MGDMSNLIFDNNPLLAGDGAAWSVVVPIVGLLLGVALATAFVVWWSKRARRGASTSK